MSDIEKRCVECGTEVPTISDTPLCSKYCQKDYIYRMVREMDKNDVWCPTCQDTFDNMAAMISHHNGSHDISVYLTELCENCNDLFRPSNPSNSSKYCSEQCFGADKQVELVASKCRNCDDTFLHYPSRNAKFCSFECANSGEFHWNWRGGSDDIRRTLEYKEWVNTIHAKFDECQKCGSTKNLHAHHIIPVSEDKSLATDVSNGVLLCGRCHSKEHPDMPEKLFERKEVLL